MKVSIKASCTIKITEGSLSWNSNTKEKFSVIEGNNSLYITQIKDKSNISITQNFGNTSMNINSARGIAIGDISGGVIISGASGDVYINGKKINISDYQDDDYKVPELTISIPKNYDLDLDVSGNSEVYSSVLLKKVNLQISGSCDVNIKCKDINVDSSGSSTINIQLAGGKASCDCSGSTDINISVIKD